MKKNKNISYFILTLFFVIICFPKSYIDDYELVRNIVGILKYVSSGLIFLIYLLNIRKKGIQKLTIFYSIFILILFISTILNERSILYFLRVYSINIAVLMFSEIIFKMKNKIDIIKFMSNYLLILLIINFITVILKAVFGCNLYTSSSTYFLGMDNRFILFIIPCLILYNILIHIEKNNKKYRIRFLLCFIIGLLSLFITWSVSSFITLLIGAILVFILEKKKIKINSIYVLISFLVINYLIVFLKVQNYFSDFIVNTLHKSMTLSYRTILWDTAISMVKQKRIYELIGLGYHSTSNVIKIYANGTGVNHLHNLIVDILYSSGIAGLFFYLYSLFNVCKSINKISNNYSRNVICILFLTLLLYLVFESFELYPIYYFIICILYYASLYKEGSDINE